MSQSRQTQAQQRGVSRSQRPLPVLLHRSLAASQAAELQQPSKPTPQAQLWFPAAVQSLLE